VPSTYSDSLRLELMATGEKSNTWGGITNTNLGTLLEQAIAGVGSVTHNDSADYSLTTANGASDEARNAVLVVGGTLTAARNLICPAQEKVYLVKNATAGGFAFTLKTSAGTGISIPNGKTALLYCDGTNVVAGANLFSDVEISGGSIDEVAITGGSADDVDITGSAVDDTPVGASTPSTGAFTDLSASGTTALTSMPTVGGTAVVASGSNANGNWTRFSDGTQICWNETLQSFLSGNPSVGTHTYTWTFPQAFSSSILYYLDAQIAHLNATSAQRFKVIGVQRREERSTTQADIFTEVTTLTPASTRLSVFAFGRWS